jgi:hypothetical protein
MIGNNQFSYPSVIERFESKFVLAPDSGCWLWTSPVNPDGYGSFSVNDKSYRAHRFSYKNYVGDIPEDMQIDHLCKTTICVNPKHLEVVTPTENVRRSDNWNAKKTQCGKGHEFTESNTYITPKGYRMCRVCAKNSMIKYNGRHKEACA